MNWTILVIVGVILIALVLFIIFRNQKDEKQLEQQLKNDYPKSTKEEADEDPEER